MAQCSKCGKPASCSCQLTNGMCASCASKAAAQAEAASAQLIVNPSGQIVQNLKYNA